MELPQIEAHFAGFQTFRETDLIKAKAAAIRFCADMASEDKPARWITFLGTSGGGKSMLSKLIVRFFQRHLDCLVDETKKDQHLRNGGTKEWCEAVGEMRQGDYSGFAQLKRDWLVSLDDIGAEHSSQAAVGKLYEVLSGRVGRFTVINANKTLEAIAAIDLRLSSRLQRDGSVVCEIETEDFNLR